MARITHRNDRMHRGLVPTAQLGSGSATSATVLLGNQTWGSAPGTSFGSNATEIGNASAGGSSSSNSRADHVHKGVHSITAAGSNNLYGDVNVAAGSGIGITQSGQTVTITNTGSSGGAAGSTLTIEEADGSPTAAATKLVLPNGTLSYVGTVATYTPAASGGSWPPLDQYTLDGTYGDHFTGASLAVKWTRRNFTSGAETYQLGINTTYIRIDPAGRANGDGYFQTAPAGDFTIAAKVIHRSWSTSTMGVGPAIIDSSGNGVSTVIYNNPIGPLLTRITTYSTYQGTFVAPGSTGTNPTGFIWSAVSPGNDVPIWYKIRKASNDYFMAYSIDGESWSAESSALTVSLTVDRIGFILNPLGTAAPSAQSRIDIDWFNKIA